ncbi:pyridoxamine 5'-phosphate oxidase family protein [Ornithinimicrobium avium]|uniref:Pyridoxamine 5'-phosphate oxidase family protein n=1 Tax=Ornithinimicrobium avium TaxID=2283195 RepID=A0A345NJH6_9MICO|nr:pyridoxamine 5'-phosphate oxidase family protein [Ornithinimicrobium avium]AXH95184.1 pyridoxamine 5'-phosphate oxidase family protein [Ornithinimicrobium avium]
MSIPVDLTALGEALGRHDTAYLLTAGEPRPHVAEVFPELVEGVVVLEEPGRTARRTVGDRPAVTVLMPPRERGGYTLIVDGEGVLDEAGALRITPSTAVLHRASSWSGHEDHDSECGNDCRPIG